MATPHISAEPGDIAPVVLMPGDPRRAQRIADELFDDARLVTEVRGILGFTGTFQGTPVSVLASGMGGPSIAIYATELARFYGVTRIVRVGTAGGLQPAMPLGTVVAASVAHTDSAMTAGWVPGVALSAAPAFSLLRAAVEAAERDAVALRVGAVFSSDTFYADDPTVTGKLAVLGTLAVEMEAATLYAVGAKEGIETLALVTVTDDLTTGEHLPALDRETGFGTAAQLALAASMPPPVS
ncbi:purine-nucleoside phosphorylase [Pseudolysinimonas yzui]|uniref:Uridine phosphorylase n=1 Tax=Pseudolysinimonas yzui TaxID=2708254 RepID=A0A8J3GND5_9MICO|nr:purine-nucleoside phosphorylase [Pseudolysinimonas yzui]GHF06719.1 purine nucleoside phosphorylase DeoD-type [Pseudolysinimonas yzui]